MTNLRNLFPDRGFKKNNFGMLTKLTSSVMTNGIGYFRKDYCYVQALDQQLSFEGRRS